MQNKTPSSQSLDIFICYASEDSSAVRNLWTRLCADGFSPWLDKEDILPGQDWDMEIAIALEKADIVIVCLSKRSVKKSGYVQIEIRLAVAAAQKQPEGTIFLIPVKLEECTIPRSLRQYQAAVDLLDDQGYEKLKRSLRKRAAEKNLQDQDEEPPPPPPPVEIKTEQPEKIEFVTEEIKSSPSESHSTTDEEDNSLSPNDTAGVHVPNYIGRAAKYSATAALALFAGYAGSGRLNSVPSPFTGNFGGDAQHLLGELLILFIPIITSIFFFLCYVECFSPRPKNEDSVELAMRKETIRIYPIFAGLGNCIIILVAYLLAYPLTFWLVFALAFQTVMCGYYGLFLFRHPLPQNIPVIRHRLVWSVILSIGINLYYGLNFSHITDSGIWLAPVVTVAVSYIVTKNLNDKGFLVTTLAIFFGLSILTLLAQSGFIRLGTGDLAGYFFTMQFCVIVSAYFAVFESWKVTSDIAIKELEISGDGAAYDIGSKSNLYSIATLMALMVSVWLLPFFFIYSQYGTLFFIFFGIHSLLAFLFWSYFGRGKTLATLDWGRYKVLMGVIFFIILVFTSFYNSPPSKPVLGGFVNWTGFFLLFIMAPFIMSKLYYSINGKPKNLLLFFTERINFLRLLGLLSLLGCAVLLVVKEYYQPDSVVYYKGEQAFIFYGVCILLCFIAELIYSLGKPNLMSTSIKNIFAFLILIRAVTSFLITLAVFLPSLYSGKDLLDSALLTIPFFLSAAGGFALNDYFDVEKDLINKPYRAIPSGALSPKFVLPFSIVSLVLAFLSAAILSHSSTEFILYILCISGVALYNVFVQYVSLSKTFLTSAVSALPILFSVIVFEYPAVYIFLPIATCFFILGREWLMDIRDLNGDLAGRMITIPMKIGAAVTARLGFGFQAAAILLLLPIVLYARSYLGSSLLITIAVSVAVSVFLWSYQTETLRRRVIQLLWLPMFFGLLLFVT